MTSNASDLKALGASAHNKERYVTDAPDPEVLETFDSPFQDMDASCSVHIEIPEFTSLCPITGQPDFAKIVIDYTPYKHCVESKSLKIYVLGYRNHGSFHEEIVARIARDLIDKLDPLMLHVEGQFTPRGGIPFWPKVSYMRNCMSVKE